MASSASSARPQTATLKRHATSCTRVSRRSIAAGSPPDGTITIGISDHAQQALGDLVFVEAPEPGRHVNAGEACAVVESVKAASDVYAPVSGDVLEANAAIVDDPAKVNADAEGEGWFVKLKLSNPGELSGLMDRAAYETFCATQ